jgi:hypothetical protein
VKRTLLTAFAVILIGLGGFAAGSVHSAPPRCYEDEVLVGSGDYAHGVWAGGWHCQPADDL